MSFIRPIHLVVAFLLELAMLFCLGYYGFHISDSGLQRFIIGIGLPVIAIVLWGFFAAPRARHRLPFPYLIIFKLALFLATATLVYSIGQHQWALTFFAVALISEFFELIFKDK